MSRKLIAFLILLFAAPLIIYLIWPTEESRLRKLFREGAGAFEARKIEDVMAKVSYNYTDEHGLSYLFLKDGGARLLNQTDSIKIEYEIQEIRVKEDKAMVAVDVRVIAGMGKDAGYIAGDAAKPLSMKFHLEKERTKWLVVKTEGLPVWY